ncbi:hypothetical protein C8T65DRAFT_730912 [Cerioporus squamosus]|nr:hypothetical protein C8T65DRAFT_730912 [Cerioporus squamosus]
MDPHHPPPIPLVSLTDKLLKTCRLHLSRPGYRRYTAARTVRHLNCAAHTPLRDLDYWSHRRRQSLSLWLEPQPIDDMTTPLNGWGFRRLAYCGCCRTGHRKRASVWSTILQLRPLPKTYGLPTVVEPLPGPFNILHGWTPTGPARKEIPHPPLPLAYHRLLRHAQPAASYG